MLRCYIIYEISVCFTDISLALFSKPQGKPLRGISLHLLAGESTSYL
uniref:Uncharacterized protein n=1 Tax=Picea glauca TaxID=3330 RepID=A0A117NHZ3_PICGL|nr:hypothetical protein ABT39_MTgene3682 [Picea glauca]